jgi:signal peptidase I
MNPGPESPEPTPVAASAEAGAAPASRRGPSWLLLGGVALLVMMLVRGLLVQSFYVPSGSMSPTIAPGDRILVNKTVGGDSLRRGDVVVFDGTSTFAAADRSPDEASGVVGRVLSGAASLVGVSLGEQDFVKRIVGLPGDRVVCCDDGGRVSVNGVSVAEDYLVADEVPSDVAFDVIVPDGRLWVMGDNRDDSADSRAHLGDPGGGTVRVDDVIGRAMATYWPLARLGGFPSSNALTSIPAPAGAQ